MKLNKAVDEVRAKEARELARRGYQPVLEHSRWCFLEPREHLTVNQKRKLTDVLRYDLRSVRACLLKEAFDGFWTYHTPCWAAWFLDRWCQRAMRSRSRKARGVRTYAILDTALYHELGRLPEPVLIRRFCRGGLR